jgi:hypothetical protein
MIKPGYDKVYTVNDYWDGPRAGIADFNGQPHYYECQFNEAKDDWSDIFLLKPIDSETLQLAMEDWDSWERWDTAYKEGKWVWRRIRRSLKIRKGIMRSLQF